MEMKIFELLNAGGNVATMALLYVMWKFDRRVYALEWFNRQHLKHLTGEK